MTKKTILQTKSPASAKISGRLMAKFNRGFVGGIYYRAKPIGKRSNLLSWLVPYVVGHNIRIRLQIKEIENHKWWNEGIILSDPAGTHQESKPFTIDPPNISGEWSKEMCIYHPLKPGYYSFHLYLQMVEEKIEIIYNTQTTTRICIEGPVRTDDHIIEDAKVMSLHIIIARSVVVIFSIVTGIIIPVIIF